MDNGRRFSRQISNKITEVAERTSSEAKNILTRTIQQREVNVFLASIIIFMSLYITFTSVLRRPLMHPLVHEDANWTFILYEGDYMNMNKTFMSESVRYSNSTMSIFLLWLASNLIGWLFKFLQLPTLLGGLVTGIVCKNLAVLDDKLYIDEAWSQFFRKAALTVILIRAGMGLDPTALRKTKGTVFRLGILATLIEAASITLVSHFLIGLSSTMSILFGIILAATSPAVTIPTMLDLMKSGYGVSSGVPSALIASCAIDNMTCIVAFNVAAALIFTTVNIRFEFSMMFTTIVLSAIGGIAGGRLLWIFPYEDSKHVHSIRWVLSLSICLALNFGTLAMEIPSAGVIATVLLNMVATIQWKKHYKGKPYKESETFAHMWNFFAMQIMFSLIGYEFDFEKVYSSVVLKAFALIGTGAAVRAVAVFCLSFGSGLRTSEQILMSLSFLSKATLQAALSPQVVDRSKTTQQHDEAHLLLSTCVIGIIIMAPIGQLILQILGPLILSRRNGETNLETSSTTLETGNSTNDKNVSVRNVCENSQL